MNTLEDIRINMQNCIKVFKEKINNIRTGNISPNILNSIKIDNYGVITPLYQLSNITVQNSSTIKIALFDPSLVKKVEKAILMSDLGINPISEKSEIKVFFPKISEERRKELIKILKKETENSKIVLRNIRRYEIKKLNLNKKISKDEEYFLQEEIEKITNFYIKEIDKFFLKKEKDLKI